jgi:arsenite-transporting ATPase
MTRILLFTGKGGVGKTTVAAATALRCGDAGLRTLVLSTDPAHSLADAYDMGLDSTPIAVAPHVWAQQLDATERFEEAWSDVQDYLVELMSWSGLHGIEAEELAVVPGLDEIFALSEIKTFATSGGWDVLIVDCAPTAETIRLLSLPDVLSWYMERLFPVGRRVTRLLRPVVSALTSLPVAGDRVFAATSKFYERLDGVRELLTDPDSASVRLVVNPERLVIAEARRTATYLSLFGYSLDAVVANRLLPDDVGDPWFKLWKEAHAEHLAAIVAGFAPVPVLQGELAPCELIGVDALREFGDRLYGDVDAATVLHRDEPLGFAREGDGYVMRMFLPFADREDLELGRHDGELQLRVGPYRRAVVLPDSLSRRGVVGATLNGDWLEVTFSKDTWTAVVDADEARPEHLDGR